MFPVPPRSPRTTSAAAPLAAVLAVVALVAVGSSRLDAQPASVRIEFSDAQLFAGTATDVTLTALDAAGEPLAGFAGELELTGAVRFDTDEAIERTGPFDAGVCHLERISIGAQGVSVRAAGGAVLGQASPRVLPGFLTLVPPLLAIVLALWTRQVLVSLFCAVWVGAALVHGTANPVAALLRAADTYVIGSVADAGHAHIVVFSLTLAGVVGVITTLGGVRGIVDAISRFATTSRSGQLSTWLLGVLIFFDDYANSLIVGNTMRPFTDRVKISREKLSFIVDATAAPVATIGVISTWTAYQLGLVRDVLPQTSTSEPQEYLFFLRSIPYCFYSLLMIAFVLLCAATLRDFGPMRAAERRARHEGKVLRDGAEPLLDDELDRMALDPKVSPRWYNGAVPIACVVVFTMIGLWVTGSDGAAPGASLREIFGNADAYKALLWAAVGATFVVIGMGLAQGLRLTEAVTAWINGARALMLAVIILVLAWSISAVCADLSTGDYVVSLTRGALSPSVVPALTFVTASLIAFSTGTSYGTMGILIPILLPLVYRLAEAAGTDPAAMDVLGFATLGAILSGAVLGDHCSPISDTTVLSSMACGADHIDHVRTQLPYALLVGAVALPSYLLSGAGMPLFVVLPLALVCLAAAFLVLSRERPAGEISRSV